MPRLNEPLNSIRPRAYRSGSRNFIRRSQCVKIELEGSDFLSHSRITV